MSSIKEALKRYLFFSGGGFTIHKSLSGMLHDASVGSFLKTGLSLELMNRVYDLTVKAKEGPVVTIGTNTEDIPIENVQKNIVVKNDVVYGELEYLSDTGFSGDSGDEELNSGFYLALDSLEHIIPNDNFRIHFVVDSNMEPHPKWLSVIGLDDEVDYYVVYVDDPKNEFLVIGDNGSPFGCKTISLSGLVCNKSAE